MQRFGFGVTAAMVVLLATGCSTSDETESGPTVDQVIERHVEAIGGAGAIDAIENIRIRPEIIEPEFTVLGDYRATREGRMRIDVFAGGTRVFSEGIDGDGGWQQGGEGEEFTDTTPLARAILARGVEFNLFGLNDLAARGHRASLFGREEIDGINYYVVHVAMDEGFERFFFINPETWMIERHREISALHPDLDDEERPAETIESNFQEHCGVLRAMEARKIDRETGEEIQRTRLLSVECNMDPDSLGIGRNEPVTPPSE
jgi:hypothetical protein